VGPPFGVFKKQNKKKLVGGLKKKKTLSLYQPVQK
jgi:hypothetical protein